MDNYIYLVIADMVKGEPFVVELPGGASPNVGEMVEFNAGTGDTPVKLLGKISKVMFAAKESDEVAMIRALHKTFPATAVWKKYWEVKPNEE